MTKQTKAAKKTERKSAGDGTRPRWRMCWSCSKTATATIDMSELCLRYNQLQDDVEVLAAHLEKQTLEHANERGAMYLLQNQLQHANMEMAHELHSFRIENEALRRQNVLLQHQRDEFERKATLALEAQEELLLALKKQKEVEEQLQNANVHIIRERAQVRKSLETTQNHCRRLEEELAAMQTHLMQLQSERKALQVAAATTNSTKHNREAEQIKAQEEMISSLRADLLQMEFEYKTLAVDREALTEKLSKLQKRVNGGSGGSSSYDVIPLGKAPLSSKQQKQLQKEQEKQQKLQTLKKNIRPARNHYESENDGFSGVMELPNFVGDRQDSSSDISLSSSSLSLSSSSGSSTPVTSAPPEKGGELRRRSSFSTLVSKTVSSAKKKLFVPSQNKNVL